MILALQALLLAVQVILFVPLLVLFLQILAAFVSKHRAQTLLSQNVSEYAIAVIVPAHNEELGLANTLTAILPQLKPSDQLVVVADNCNDQTASIAKSMGAFVLERFNLQHRGKGYALDHAMKYLVNNAPDIVIIVDADCIVADNLVATLASECMNLQRPVQANYLMTFEQKTGLKQQVTEFAWLVKNTVRPLGYKTLGFPCQLMGTGMAFLWKDLSACNLASGHLVEDMQLGLDLAKMGKPPLFTMGTHVHSYFPVSVQGQSTQRARWEHGHLSVILNELPKILNTVVSTKNKLLFAQALDIAVPPLALLFLITMATSLLSVAIWALAESPLNAWLSLLQLAILGMGIILAWYRFGRDAISFSQLLMAPVILMMKLPIYVGFLFQRQVDWVRSKRD